MPDLQYAAPCESESKENNLMNTILPRTIKAMRIHS